MVTSFIVFVFERKCASWSAERGTKSSDPVPVGPVTSARAKKFREALNELILATWAQVNSGLPIEGDERYFQRWNTIIPAVDWSLLDWMNLDVILCLVSFVLNFLIYYIWIRCWLGCQSWLVFISANFRILSLLFIWDNYG